MRFSTLLPLCVLLAAQAPSGWKRLDAVRADGYERFANGPEERLSVSRSRGMLAFTTARGLNGRLVGVERRETSGPKGSFTWIPSDDRWAIHLPTLSTDYYASLLTITRYSRTDLTDNVWSIEKNVNKQLHVWPDKEIAGRKCLLVSVADKAGLNTYQSLWIDSETGIVLRRQDGSRRQNDYELRFQNLVTDYRPEAAEFEPPVGATLIRGPVDADILRVAGKPRASGDYSRDILETSRKAKLGGDWIRKIEEPKGFEYAHTTLRERGPLRAVRPRIGASLASPELQPGGLPPGWNISGAVDPEKGTILLDFSNPQGGNPKALVSMPSSGANAESSFTMTMSGAGPGGDNLSLSFVTYIAPDGTLVIAPGTSAKEAEERRQQAREIEAGAYSVVQSDFLDRETGDSISFIQSRNARLSSLLPGFTVRSLPALTSARLGEIKVYLASEPYRVNVVSWKTETADYLLASTRLRVEELARLAETATAVKR